MTDKLRELTLLALESHGCERLKDFYECGPVQRAAVETFLEAALAQQDAQAVPQCEYCKRGLKAGVCYCKPAWQTPVAWGNFKEDGTLVGLSQHPEDQANWIGRKPLYTAPRPDAPTPPAQPAQQDAQDHSDLYARGWINGTQVQSLIDWCNSGSTKRADIAFTGGPSRQIAYAIEHLVKRASNLETSEGVFVPRELLAKVANALGLPYEEEHTRLRSKLLDILSFAAPAQRVMLTDDEIERLWYPSAAIAEPGTRRVAFGRAVIEAYERKNGISQPGYTAPDMASQGASQFRAGHDAAQSEIAELEQENRLLRARNDRLQKEIEQKGER